MRTLKVYLHGATMGTPPRNNSHLRAKRGNVTGWSSSATRRNVAFLRSVVPDTLMVDHNGEYLHGYAFTLTLKNCPPTAEDWHKIRKAFVERLRRAGMYRLHWVTEWQRRGVPHLHGCVWATDPKIRLLIIGHWLSVAAQYEAGHRGQHVNLLTDAVGWFKYLAKHAARGVQHYQRSSENIPAGWIKTGRVWGYSGEWDTRDHIQIKIEDATYYRLRRLVRSWRKADARQSGDKYRIKSSRTMLECHLRGLSEVRGISEWVDQETMLTLLDCARGLDRVEG